jgi:hypothetical protein
LALAARVDFDAFARAGRRFSMRLFAFFAFFAISILLLFSSYLGPPTQGCLGAAMRRLR